MKKLYKKLRKKVPGTEFSYDQAVRVYLYNKAGYDVPGISKSDLNELLKNSFLTSSSAKNPDTIQIEAKPINIADHSILDRVERVSLIKQNQKTLSVLCGKLDAAPLAYKKIKNLIRKIN